MRACSVRRFKLFRIHHSDRALALHNTNKLPRWAYSQTLDNMRVSRHKRNEKGATSQDAHPAPSSASSRVIFRAGPMRLQSCQLPSRSDPPPNPEGCGGGNEGMGVLGGVRRCALHSPLRDASEQVCEMLLNEAWTPTVQRLGTTLATMSTYT